MGHERVPLTKGSVMRKVCPCLLLDRQLLHTVHHQCEWLLLGFCSHRVSLSMSTEKPSIVMMSTLSALVGLDIVGYDNHWCDRDDSHFSLVNAKFLVKEK